MTSPGRYAASDGSFAKSAGSAAARGGILIAIAVVIGLVLLAWGFDGGDSDATVGPVTDPTDSTEPTDSTDPADSTDTTDSTDPTDSTDTTDSTDPTDSTDTTDGTGDTDPVVLDDPSTVKVAVLNGTGTGGLAGQRAGILGAANYVALAGNAVGRPDITASMVYFVTGYGDEAKVVAEALGGPPSVLELAPDDPTSLEDGTAAETGSAHIIVVLGTDELLS